MRRAGIFAECDELCRCRSGDRDFTLYRERLNSTIVRDRHLNISLSNPIESVCFLPISFPFPNLFLNASRRWQKSFAFIKNLHHDARDYLETLESRCVDHRTPQTNNRSLSKRLSHPKQTMEDFPTSSSECKWKNYSNDSPAYKLPWNFVLWNCK